MRLRGLLHKNPSGHFIKLLLIYLFYGMVIYVVTMLLISKLDLFVFNISYIIFMTETIILFIFCGVVIYFGVRRFIVLKRKIFLSDLVYAHHETTTINMRVVEVLNVHLDNPVGLRTLGDYSKSGNRISKASYFVNEAIDSIITVQSQILANPEYSKVEYIIGESHHICLFKKRFEKLGIRAYPLEQPFNIVSSFVLMWIYNIRVYKKLYPSFNVGSTYRFEIPVAWLENPYNQAQLLNHKRK